MASADTKERILAAAEALFARNGFAATSLRHVIADAGVNLAAVHYHFGSKDELVREVFASRFDPINEERLRLLSLVEARKDGGLAVEAILECLILPILRAAREQSEGWSVVAALVGRVHTEPDQAVRRIFYDQFEEVGDRFLKALALALPDLPGVELYSRFHFAIAAMAASLVNPAEVRFLSKGRLDPTADSERFVRHWSTFVAAGLKAAASPDGSTPDGSTPDVSTPDVSTPDGSTPDGSTPDGSTPRASDDLACERPAAAAKAKPARRATSRQGIRR